MTGHSKTFYLFLILAGLIAVLGAVNFAGKASLPFGVQQTSRGVVVHFSPLPREESAGRLLASADSHPIKDVRQLDAILEWKNVGDSLLLGFDTGFTRSIPLAPATSGSQILINVLLGVFFFLMAVVVWEHARAGGERYFAFSAVLLGAILMEGGTGMHLPLEGSLLVNWFYFFAYPFAFLSFLYFCHHFPLAHLAESALRRRKQKLTGLGILLTTLLLSSYLTAIYTLSVPGVIAYDVLYRAFRGLIMLLLVASVAMVFHNLRRDPNPENYRKAYWLMGGIMAGSAPFLLFWNLPQLLGYAPLLPEWLVTLGLLAIPISITIAIVRHRLFDIEIILSRSMVYFAVLAILLALYVLGVGGLSLVVYRQFSLQTPLFSIVTAVLIGLAFNPLKEQVSQVVSRNFFRIRYDRFQALKSLLAALENCYTTTRVIETLMGQYQQVIPLSESFVARREGEHWDFEGLAEPVQRDWERWLEENMRHPLPEKLINKAHQPLVEDGEREHLGSFPKNGVLLVPIGEEGLWCLGKKRSGARFWKEDIDLARQMAQAAALQLEKVKYFQKAAQEAVEKKQAQQLSRWKSLLVAEVAHDLRSPLNTILWKLRNLQPALQEQEQSSLHPMVEIGQQIEHLQALIQALLILPRLEEGKFQPRWQTLPLRCVVEEVLSHLEGMISGKGLRVTVDCPADLTIQADLTLLKEILLNLLENSAKFSPPGKAITVRAFREPCGEKERVRILISDQAGGIPPEQLELLFEPFHEGKQSDERIHLGLYIAREFTRAMGGELQLTSAYGTGTEVTLSFWKGQEKK